MGLSCSCDDFDKGEYDTWWEVPYRAPAPAGAMCCECGAPIPAGLRTWAIDTMEVYTPDVEPPRSPWDVDANEMSDEAFEALEKTWDTFCETHGYDDEYERFERCAGTEYRCERCDDLATALDGSAAEGGLGFCTIGPGQLIEAHLEYVSDYVGGPPMVWVRDKAGILNPRRKTKWELARDEAVRRGRRVKSFLRWELRFWVKRKIIYPALRALGYRYEYDFDARGYVWRRA